MPDMHTWDKAKEIVEGATIDSFVDGRQLDPEQTLLVAELIENIFKHAFGNMSPRKREVFELYVGEGLTIKEIANQLNLGHAMISYHLQVAVSAMREAVRVFCAKSCPLPLYESVRLLLFKNLELTIEYAKAEIQASEVRRVEFECKDKLERIQRRIATCHTELRRLLRPIEVSNAKL